MTSITRILGRAVLFGSLALVLTLRPAADARANSTLDWLSGEPVTLMDLGIIRLKQDLLQVGQRLLEIGFLPVAPTTGAYFDWRDKKITVFLTARERFAQPSEGMCLELFSRVAKGLSSRSAAIRAIRAGIWRKSLPMTAGVISPVRRGCAKSF